MTLLQVQLARDCLDTPWGFRLQGGKDLNQPLVVQRVFANSPSERELQRGDIIVSIGGRDTTHLTHKQAQDAIAKGGGQIEFLVSRPPAGKVNIQPLSPTRGTRAPAYPQTPTKAPQITIPIEKLSGPQSPRVIPVSPQPPYPRIGQSDPSMSASAGHIPTKITLNKYGGGNMDFGYSPSSQRAPQASSYRPVPAPVRDQPDYGAQTHYSAPQQFSPNNQFSAPTRNEVVKRSHKPLPSFGRPASSEEVTFGLDFSKPQAKPSSKPTKTRERPPAVNARRGDDETDLSWNNTLRGEGGRLKPWEIEALEMEKYQGGTVDQPYRPSMAPQPAPKPRITQITAQSVAHPVESSPGGASPQKQPVPLGERDWSNSAVYQMIHSSKSTTSQQGPDGETVTHTRVTEEKKYPGKEPQRTVTETVSRGAAPVQDYRFDAAYGISDF